ncbi:MAG TPA: hypothetical protein VKR31_11020 [Rhizomicrobium sp.]|nr:hypothetical protein [Rhizomicrobium sp.]
MHLSPFIVPLLIGALLLRRALRVQKPQTVRTTRMWIFPGLLLVVTVMSLWHEGFPGILVTLVFIAAAAAGAAIGWFRVHTLEFSLDAESGKVSARATQLGAVLIVGLIAIRYLGDYAIKAFGFTAGLKFLHATDATLVFSTSMLVARSVHTAIKARALIAAHRAATVPGTDTVRAPATIEQNTPGP